MRDKIALEEHVSTEAMNAVWDDAGEASRNGKDYMGWVEERLLDIPKRLQDMDGCGIATTVLSMTSPGVQGIADADTAVSSAKDTHDTIYRTFVEPYPERFAFFACVPLQDPDAAAEELQRSVSELAAKGALVNGYTNVGGKDTARYLDEPENEPFWAKVAERALPHPHPGMRDQRNRLRPGDVLSRLPLRNDAAGSTLVRRLPLVPQRQSEDRPEQRRTGIRTPEDTGPSVAGTRRARLGRTVVARAAPVAKSEHPDGPQSPACEPPIQAGSPVLRHRRSPGPNVIERLISHH